MTYEYKDRKIVCVVSEALELWQAMNVVGHMSISLGAHKDEFLMGRDQLCDASGIKHPGIARYGLIIKKGNPNTIRAALEMARSMRGVSHVEFPREMLDTSHDDELSDSISKKEESGLEYLGALFYGATTDINVITKKFPLWS